MSDMNTKLAVAKAVGTPLVKLERMIAAAQEQLALVQSTALKGHTDARLPLTWGQDGLAQLAAANVQLMTFRQTIHAAHLDFRDVQDKMDLPVISYGDHGDTPREGDALMPRGAMLSIVDAA